MDNEEIVFRSSTLKLRVGSEDTATLSWNVSTAKSVVLDVPGIGVLHLANYGQYSVQPKVSTTYKLTAKFDGSKEQVKHLTVEVLPEAKPSFDAIEIQDSNGVHAELRWSIANALETKLDGEPVQNSGFRKYLITDKITPTIEYRDAFGTRKKIFTIEPTRSMKYYLIIAFYAVFKLLVRPFTFIGKVSPREYKWTTILFVCCLLVIIAQTIFPVYERITHGTIGYKILVSYPFVNLYSWVTILLFPWLMQLGKRFKDNGSSPWLVLWFAPLFSIHFLPQLYYQIGLASIPVLCFYGIYFFIFLMTSFNMCGKSTFGLSTEFIPSFMLQNKKMKKLIIR